jgi:hypothetical protein
MATAEILEKKLGYKFTDAGLLSRALRHASLILTTIMRRWNLSATACLGWPYRKFLSSVIRRA